MSSASFPNSVHKLTFDISHISCRFGCDVGQFSNSGLGIMDTGLFDYKGTFGTNLGMSKAQRLQTGESAMTHAMGMSDS